MNRYVLALIYIILFSNYLLSQEYKSTLLDYNRIPNVSNFIKLDSQFIIRSLNSIENTPGTSLLVIDFSLALKNIIDFKNIKLSRNSLSQNQNNKLFAFGYNSEHQHLYKFYHFDNELHLLV